MMGNLFPHPNGHTDSNNPARKDLISMSDPVSFSRCSSQEQRYSWPEPHQQPQTDIKSSA